MLYRIQPLELDACIRRPELPVDGANALVALLLPALHLPTQLLGGGNVVSKPLPRQNAQLNLGDVEPAGMDGGWNGFPTDRLGPWPVAAGTPRRTRQAYVY